MARYRNIAVALILATAACIAPSQSAQNSQAPQPSASSADPNTATGSHDKLSPGIKDLIWQPNELEQGSVAFFTVEFERAPMRVTARWIGKEVKFFRSGDPKVWYALAGADLETHPGSYDLKLTAVAGGRVMRAVKTVPIAAANFGSGDVTVPENFVEPNAAEKRQIAADGVLKNRAFARATPTPLWSGNFITPVHARPTDTFGKTRLFNEELTSTHRGTDFPIAEGAPVVVSNSGTVVLAKELFNEGNCVIVDHGDRFFTTYMHLSKIEVKAGQRLKKGARVSASNFVGFRYAPFQRTPMCRCGPVTRPVLPVRPI